MNISQPLKTPVVLILFKRKDKSLAVLNELRKVAPATLFLVADAGRTPEEETECAATRQAVEAAIDWPCTIHKLYAEHNMGGWKRIPSGISWAFEHTDTLIILEDDTVPDPSFLTFAEQILERHRADERIMAICGFLPTDSLTSMLPTPSSYFFSQFPSSWGWATWKRAWEKQDPSMSAWPDVQKSKFLEKKFKRAVDVERWQFLFSAMYKKIISGERASWDTPWVLRVFTHNGLCIYPSVNTITNVGDDTASQHSKGRKRMHSARHSISFPLTHPPTLDTVPRIEHYFMDTIWKTSSDPLRELIARAKLTLPAIHALVKRLRNNTSSSAEETLTK